MADKVGVRRLARPLERVSIFSRLSLTARILAVNILPLALLGGGIVYLDSYRAQLLDERYKLARIEAQITAEALAGARPRPCQPLPQRPAPAPARAPAVVAPRAWRTTKPPTTVRSNSCARKKYTLPDSNPRPLLSNSSIQTTEL